MESEEFITWLAQLRQATLPTFESLPDLPLYMDQVVTQVNRYLVPLTLPPITKTMINSYVKQGIIDKPVKKKYTQEHLAELLVVSLTKQVFALEDIKQGILTAVKQHSAGEEFDFFVAVFNQQLQALTQGTTGALVNPQQSSFDNVKVIAARAVIYKIMGVYLMRQTLPDPE